MATAIQVTALILAFRENDRDRFITTALQLADHEAKNGHRTVAHEIQRLVTNIKEQPKAILHSFTTPEKSMKDLRDDLYILSKPEERMEPMTLTEQLKRFLLEQRECVNLLSHGLLLGVKPSSQGHLVQARP